jgi:hypothetical protein
MFYFFFESRNNPKDDPLVLWMTGEASFFYCYKIAHADWGSSHGIPGVSSVAGSLQIYNTHLIHGISDINGNKHAECQ